MKSTLKVCTVVVTYNRYELLFECLAALLNQTYHTDILVVDNNSTQKEYISIEDKFRDKRVIYKKLNENLGGAGGFSFGMNYALESSYDYVWVMDDDAEPELNALELLLDKINDQNVAFASTVFTGTKDNNILTTIGHRGNFDYQDSFPTIQKSLTLNDFEKETCNIDMASFVGLLVSTKVVKKIGLPRKEFFIHHDDTEFSLRLNKYGKILLVRDSKVYHKEKRQDEKYIKNFLWLKKNRIKYEMLWIKFFGFRNSVYIAKEFSRSKKTYLKILWTYLVLIKDIFLYDDYKLKRFRFATESLLDGLKGVFDNQKPRRILYGKNYEL